MVPGLKPPYSKCKSHPPAPLNSMRGALDLIGTWPVGLLAAACTRRVGLLAAIAALAEESMTMLTARPRTSTFFICVCPLRRTRSVPQTETGTIITSLRNNLHPRILHDAASSRLIGKAHPASPDARVGDLWTIVDCHGAPWRAMARQRYARVSQCCAMRKLSRLARHFN